MKYLNLTALTSTFVTLSLLACSGAHHHRQAVGIGEGDRVSVGTVQREIRIGMSGADVAQALGSPNIVTTDEKRREVWIYDKISTERVVSGESGGVASLIFGGAGVGDGIVGGGALPHYSSSSGASSTSQQTFTVIIKFDDHKLVRDFAYHTSRF